MTIFQLIKAAFTAPKELIAARKVSFPKTFLYILLLSLLLAIPVVVDLSQMVRQIQGDFEKIGSKIPADTSFKDNKLSTEQKDSGFIYQTDYLIFTFDPEGKTNAKNIQEDLVGNVFGIALLKDDLVFAFDGENNLASTLPKSPIHLSYNTLDPNLIKEQWWGGRVQSPLFIVIFAVITLLFALIPIALDLAISLLLLTLLANVFNAFRGVRLKIPEIFKLMTFSATLAVVVTVLVELFLTSANTNVILMMITILTYYRVLPTPPRGPKEL